MWEGALAEPERDSLAFYVLLTHTSNDLKSQVTLVVGQLKSSPKARPTKQLRADFFKHFLTCIVIELFDSHAELVQNG